MPHNEQKARQESSLIGRLLSMEVMLLLMGILSLIYGIVESKSISIFWGCMIIPGVFILNKVRKKDWDKHWDEMAAQKNAYEARKKAESMAEESKHHDG